MDTNTAIDKFGSLAQETRLDAFRLLVQAGPEGLPAGQISEALGVPHNTLSFHLNHLSAAGLIESRKAGRSVIYRAQFDAINSLISFLVKDCCSADMASVREDKQRGCSVIELTACC